MFVYKIIKRSQIRAFLAEFSRSFGVFFKYSVHSGLCYQKALLFVPFRSCLGKNRCNEHLCCHLNFRALRLTTCFCFVNNRCRQSHVVLLCKQQMPTNYVDARWRFQRMTNLEPYFCCDFFLMRRKKPN